MNFTVLPPELNSARMFTGAGLGPMLAAAGAWDGLASELHAAAGSFSSATSELAGQAWQGPAALAMTRTAARYATWLSTAAGQAEHAAASARLAASAFAAGFAATVHPIVVADNRTALVSLVGSDLLGQNAPAIAAAEAEYERMWAQDVAAMSDYYAGAAAAAAQLTPWHQLLENLQVKLGSAAESLAASGLPAISVDVKAGTFNVGNGNIGVNNIGNGNTGNGNIGNANIGNANFGVFNIGDANVGIGNTGNGLIGFGLPGDGNVGVGLIPLPQVGAGPPLETALIMGGTGFNPLPRPADLAAAERFLNPTHPAYLPQFLVTPSKLFPLTGLASLTVNASVAQGVLNLDAAIMGQHAMGLHTIVAATSQSALVATLEMRHLETLPAALRPGPDDLSFVLTGNLQRPNGGIIARLGAISLPFVNLPAYGATPANAYPTIDYALQYDGFADFPRYPLNLVASANAVAGMLYVHPTYNAVTTAQIASGVVQPVSADSLTTYILIPTQNLPLLEPLRAIPIVGNPLADLIQPDLRVLVELGYDRAAYQDVSTPFGLFGTIDPAAVAAELQLGAIPAPPSGINDALARVGLSHLPPLSCHRMG
jgi:hypothetical protein